jgi:hypothetical protein
MAPRRIVGKKMKSHNFYCSEELWKEMQADAERHNESDSEYIRNAINKRVSATFGKSEVKKILPEQIKYNESVKADKPTILYGSTRVSEKDLKEYLSDTMIIDDMSSDELSESVKKTTIMEAAEALQPMELVAEKDGKAVKADKLTEALSKEPKYPKGEKQVQTFFKGGK